ncbi:MAG: hypothetical protein ACYCUI_13700 [Vulcanimicrobiaceae bacterium]
MKDKLMELAEQWKKEPLLGVYRMAVHACADDLIYHLDAIDAAIAARTVTTLTDALRALEEYAMAGVTLGTDDSKRLHATVDRIAPIAARVVEWAEQLTEKGDGFTKP